MLAGKTTVKGKDSFEVTGLNRGVKYYFAVQTETLPHTGNPNRLISDYSQSAETILE